MSFSFNEKNERNEGNGGVIMATFYIDYENVHNAGLKGLELLSKDDYVYIFYSEHANTFNVQSMKLALQSVCGIEFVEATIGIPNAMDFQIVTMVYATVDTDDCHYIISKDRGFDVAINMGKKCNCTNVERYQDIGQAYTNYMKKKNSIYREVVEALEDKPEATLVNISSEIEIGINEEKLAETNKKKIKQFIEKESGVTVSKDNLDIAYEGLVTCTTKMQLYNYLRNKLGNDAGKKLYKVVGESYYELKKVV